MGRTGDGFALEPYLAEKRNLVDRSIDGHLNRYEKQSGPPHLIRAMRYCLEAGGKRLRPILCIAACEAVGGSGVVAVPTACALEFIHTYSLIHDDLPAMDNDDLRRGKPTCHKAFGEGTAVLAGDALLTAAFEILSAAVKNGPAPACRLEVIRVIAGASGALGMVQGQMLDLAFEGENMAWEQIRHMEKLKTGALIKASVESGALLGGADNDALTAMRSYGEDIGLAFQMADDILNVESRPEILGKPVGSDKKKKKATCLTALGLERAKREAASLVDRALAQVESLGEGARPLGAIARYVVERKR